MICGGCGLIDGYSRICPDCGADDWLPERCQCCESLTDSNMAHCLDCGAKFCFDNCVGAYHEDSGEYLCVVCVEKYPQIPDEIDEDRGGGDLFVDDSNIRYYCDEEGEEF